MSGVEGVFDSFMSTDVMGLNMAGSLIPCSNTQLELEGCELSLDKTATSHVYFYRNKNTAGEIRGGQPTYTAGRRARRHEGFTRSSVYCTDMRRGNWPSRKVQDRQKPPPTTGIWVV